MNRNEIEHIGLIPDGNRRYAKKRRLSLARSYAHGATVGLRIIDWCRREGAHHVSFYAISDNNLLRRTPREIETMLASILYFCKQVKQCFDTCLHIVGDLPKGTDPETILAFAELRRNGVAPRRMTVHVHVGYVGNVEGELAPMFRAIRATGIDKVQENPAEFIRSANVPPMDLIIRTGGRQRLSGFLPFQSAFAELYFIPLLWGEMKKRHFDLAMHWFRAQKRNMGE